MNGQIAVCSYRYASQIRIFGTYKYKTYKSSFLARVKDPLSTYESLEKARSVIYGLKFYCNKSIPGQSPVKNYGLLFNCQSAELWSYKWKQGRVLLGGERENVMFFGFAGIKFYFPVRNKLRELVQRMLMYHTTDADDHSSAMIRCWYICSDTDADTSDTSAADASTDTSDQMLIHQLWYRCWCIIDQMLMIIIW